jgi:hypothetical protein
MARFVLITPVTDAAIGRKLKTGQTISDTSANAQVGDVVLPSFTNSPSPLNVLPLDAAAQAKMPPGTAIYVPGTPLPPSPWGVGLDAGI